MSGASLRLALALCLASAAALHAPTAQAQTSDPFRDPSAPGRFTVQGQSTEGAEPPQPHVPFAVSAVATLAVAATGFVLVVPELSITHVLGFRHDANRMRGYLGLGVLCLAPPLGLGLSGAHLGSVLVAPFLEAGIIGLAFGLAYVTDATLRSGGDGAGHVLALSGGYSLLTITIPVIAVAALVPVLCAFISGADLEQEEAGPGPGSFGMVPVPGGAVATLGWRW